jgi:threonyl-tRNA synthetase
VINVGEGAFYGPKIDIKLKDALKRSWQCATIQCDFALPKRFELAYVDADGKEKQPIMLHRVLLGSLERVPGH